MSLYRIIGRKGTQKRWHFRNGVLITLGLLLVLFGFWVCFFSDWLPNGPEEGGAADAIGVVSAFCDDFCLLPVSASKTSTDELRSVVFRNDQTPVELMEIIESASDEDFTYTAELYTLSGCTDILVTKTRDSGKVDCYLLRRYGDDIWVMSRMRADNLLIPMHLMPAREAPGGAAAGKLSGYTTYDDPTEYEGKYIPVCAGPEEFYAFYAATGRYQVERIGDEVYLYGHTDMVDYTVCEELSVVTTTGGYRETVNSVQKRAEYAPPVLDTGLKLSFKQIEGSWWIMRTGLSA